VKWTILHSKEQPEALYSVCKTLQGMLCTAGLPFNTSRTLSLTFLSSSNWTHFISSKESSARISNVVFWVETLQYLICSYRHFRGTLCHFSYKSATFLTWLTSALNMKASCLSETSITTLRLHAVTSQKSSIGTML
jgi:hypothetical protein